MDFSYLDDWGDDEAIVEEIGEGYRNVWVFAEVVDGELVAASLEAVGQARTLADQIGVYVYGVLLGNDTASGPEALFASGADKVLSVRDTAVDEYQPEIYTHALAELVTRYRPEILLLSATPLGRDLAPRLAQRLRTGLISNCVKLELDMAERLLLGTFEVLGGEMYHTVACPTARPQMATLRPGYFPLPYRDGSRTGEADQVELDLTGVAGCLTWTNLAAAVDLPRAPLGKAKIVVAAGRGMGNAAGFALVQQLAEALGGTFAGSRGAFDEGWIEEDRIVGIGGTFVAPDLYLACGISGDLYHSFALDDAKFVVAINTDENAPIFRIANMAIVGDAGEIIPAMLEALAH